MCQFRFYQSYVADQARFDIRSFIPLRLFSYSMLQPAMMQCRACSSSKKERLVKKELLECTTMYECWWEHASPTPFLPLLLDEDRRREKTTPPASPRRPKRLAELEPASVEEAKEMMARLLEWIE
ncbi:hypothetical protein AMTR_s00141p00064230, partial [Amborella trichopoda]